MAPSAFTKTRYIARVRKAFQNAEQSIGTPSGNLRVNELENKSFHCKRVFFVGVFFFFFFQKKVILPLRNLNERRKTVDINLTKVFGASRDQAAANEERPGGLRTEHAGLGHKPASHRQVWEATAG